MIDTSTVRVIAAATKAGILNAQDGQLLGDACKLMHDLTQVLRLALNKPFVPAEASPALRQLLARAGAMPDFSTLEAHLFETQGQVRAVFERLLSVPTRDRRRRRA